MVKLNKIGILWILIVSELFFITSFPLNKTWLIPTRAFIQSDLQTSDTFGGTFLNSFDKKFRMEAWKEVLWISRNFYKILDKQKALQSISTKSQFNKKINILKNKNCVGGVGELSKIKVYCLDVIITC